MKLHVIHNDEVVEMGEESRSLGLIGIQQQRIGGAVDVCVTLNAPLGIEDEVVAASAFGKGQDGVRNHAVEPAQAILAGDSNAGTVAEVEDSVAAQCGGHFLIAGKKGL